MYKVKFSDGYVENISYTAAKELIKRAFCTDVGNNVLEINYDEEFDIEIEYEIRYLIDQLELKDEIYKQCTRGFDPFADYLPTDLFGDDEE